jgi:RNA polymerase-binding transcription factor DksA
MSLTKAQLKHLEERLRDERQRTSDLLDTITGDGTDGSDQDQSGDLSKVPFHMADLGTTTMDEELDRSNATRISQELAEIDAALERLVSEPEKYGICENTGEAIPFERLDIIPWARTTA